MWYDVKVDAVNALIDCLECGYDGYYCDLFNEVFNMDYYVNYYVTGTAEAKSILGDDVFDAIGRIYTYEKDNFGEIYTDLSNPIRIANMLFYIIGTEIMYNNGEFSKILDEHWNEYADEETNIELVKALKNSEIF